METKKICDISMMRILCLLLLLVQGCATAEVGKTKFNEFSTAMSMPTKFVYLNDGIGDATSAMWRNYYTKEGEILHLCAVNYFVRFENSRTRQVVRLFSFDKSNDHLLTRKKFEFKRVTGRPVLEDCLTKEDIISKLGAPKNIYFGEFGEEKQESRSSWSGIKEIYGKVVGDEILYYELNSGKEIVLVLIDEKTKLMKGVMRLVDEPIKKKELSGDEIAEYIEFWETPLRPVGYWMREKIAGDIRYFDTLILWSKEPGEVAQRNAIELIGELKEPTAYDYLITMLNNKDNKYQHARSASASVLGKKNNPKALAPLLETVKGCGELILCKNAIYSIALLGDEHTVRPLMEIFNERKRWPLVDQEIAAALNKLAHQTPPMNSKQWLDWWKNDNRSVDSTGKQ